VQSGATRGDQSTRGLLCGAWQAALRPIRCVERLGEVADDVVGMFEPYRKPHTAGVTPTASCSAGDNC
jgi:hypothetical protein